MTTTLKPFRVAGAVAPVGSSAAKAGGNTGNGTITAAPETGTSCKAGVYRVRCTAAVANAGTFSVRDPDGIEIGPATVAVEFTKHLTFTIADGAADFIVGDGFDITVEQQLAPGSTIPEDEVYSALVGTEGVGVMLIRAKVTGSGTGTLRVVPLLADASSLAGSDLFAPVTLIDDVEGVMEVALAGAAYARISIEATGDDMAVEFVDVYMAPPGEASSAAVAYLSRIMRGVEIELAEDDSIVVDLRGMTGAVAYSTAGAVTAQPCYPDGTVLPGVGSPEMTLTERMDTAANWYKFSASGGDAVIVIVA